MPEVALSPNGLIAAWCRSVTTSVDRTAASFYEDLDAEALAAELGEWLRGVLPITPQFSSYQKTPTGALAAFKRHAVVQRVASSARPAITFESAVPLVFEPSRAVASAIALVHALAV